MANEGDKANDTAEVFLKAALNRARKPVDTSNPDEVCWCCGAETGPDKRWCDADCRDIWQKEEE